MKKQELSSKTLYFDGNGKYYFRSHREKIVLSVVGTKDGIY